MSRSANLTVDSRRRTRPQPAMNAEPPARPRRALLPQLRAAGTLLAALSAARGLYDLQVTGQGREGWLLLLAAVLIATVAQAGLRYPAPPPATGRAGLVAAALDRFAIALAGATLWTMATLRIYQQWATGFDLAWMGWTSAVVLLAIGLDLAWGIWPHPGSGAGARRCCWRWRRCWRSRRSTGSATSPNFPARRRSRRSRTCRSATSAGHTCNG